MIRDPITTSLYVHVPVCVSKCAYCDFHSSVLDESLRAPLVDALLFEAGHWSFTGLLDDVASVYIGGGTPTALGSHELLRLVSGVCSTAQLRAGAEVTVETNPETTDFHTLVSLAAGGVTRVSVGIQSFDDAVLRTLGRVHDAARAKDACAALAASGIEWSLDLICGVPGQTMASWRETLDIAVRSGMSHASVYPLTIEEGTPLALAVAAGELPEPDADVAADMMLVAETAFAAAGLRRYEVASYAVPGHEARHNTGYWTGMPYVGIGPSASSMLPADEAIAVGDAEGWPALQRPDADSVPAPARVRFTRAADTFAYLRAPIAAPADVEWLTLAQADREDVMLGLRLSGGVTSEQVERTALVDVLEGLEHDGLVERAKDAAGLERWRTTARGWLLGNEVFGRVWNAPCA